MVFTRAPLSPEKKIRTKTWSSASKLDHLKSKNDKKNTCPVAPAAVTRSNQSVVNFPRRGPRKSGRPKSERADGKVAFWKIQMKLPSRRGGDWKRQRNWYLQFGTAAVVVPSCCSTGPRTWLTDCKSCGRQQRSADRLHRIDLDDDDQDRVL